MTLAGGWPSAHAHITAPYVALTYTVCVNVIAPRTLREFWERHPRAQEPLRIWLKLMQRTDFANWAELRAAFPRADYVSDANLVIFNIGGNKYRLIADVSFRQNRVFIKRILTHAEYDKWNHGGRS